MGLSKMMFARPIVNTRPVAASAVKQIENRVFPCIGLISAACTPSYADTEFQCRGAYHTACTVPCGTSPKSTTRIRAPDREQIVIARTVIWNLAIARIEHFGPSTRNE
jgi:hypothetical protein